MNWSMLHITGMDPDAAALVHTHLWLNQPVLPGGVLNEVNIFNRTPVALEQIHPQLWFLVRNIPSTRQAVNGR